MEISNMTLKTGRKKFGIGPLILFILIGLAFGTAGFFLVQNSNIDKSWVRVDGTVVRVTQDVSTGTNRHLTYTPTIEYQVDGATYEVTSNSSSQSEPTIGSVKEIAYDPSNPSKAKVVVSSGDKLLFWGLIGLGPLLVILGIFLFYKSRKRSEAIADLTVTGYKVKGVIVDIQSTNYNNSGFDDEDNNSVHLASNTHEYKIIVAAPDTYGAVRQFKSDTITGVGGIAIADFHSTPIPIDVYIDPVNPENYYVDISGIPTLTRERISDIVRNAVQGAAPTPQPSQTPPPQQPHTSTPTPETQGPIGLPGTPDPWGAGPSASGF